MNFTLFKSLYLKSFVLLFFLFFSFSLQAKIAMPVEGPDCDTQKNFFTSKVRDIRAALWKNTPGVIREITKKEREGDVISVGKIQCKVNSKIQESTATIVGYAKGGTYLLLAGHSVCDGNQLLNPNQCVFIKKYWRKEYPQYYGQEFEYPVTQIVKDGICDNDPNTDMAMIFLKSGVPGEAAPVVLSDQKGGLNLTRVKKNNDVSYINNKTNKSGKMFVVGRDAIYNKLMLSENCGIFKKSSGQFNSDLPKELALDCKTTPGYSGGPVFYKEKGAKAKLVCVNTGSVTAKDKTDYRYQRFNIRETGTNCVRLDRSNYIALRRRLDNL